MLVIINDTRVMGDHVNSKIYNYMTWTTVVIMIGLSAGLIVTTFYKPHRKTSADIQTNLAPA